jgi:hypothetical protein
MFANANSCSDDGEKKDKILKCQTTNLPQKLMLVGAKCWSRIVS